MSKRPRDVQEAKGCPGGQGMSRRPRDVQEANGCPRGQWMSKRPMDVQEAKARPTEGIIKWGGRYDNTHTCMSAKTRIQI